MRLRLGDDQHGVIPAHKSALETDVVVPCATNQQAAAYQRPTFDDDPIKHHEQTPGAGRRKRQTSGRGRRRIANDTERAIGNPNDGNIKVETFTRKLPEPGHAGRIENPAEGLGARQHEGGGRYGSHPYPRQDIQKLQHTRPASFGILDQKYGATPASALVAQKHDEQIMEVIEFSRLNLETELHQCPRQEFMDAVAWCINPHQMQVLPRLPFSGQAVEQGSEHGLHAADKDGK